MAIDKNTNGPNNATKSPAKKVASKKSLKKKKGKSKKRIIFKRIFLSLLFLMLTVMVIGAGYVFAIIKSTPPLDMNAVLNLSQPTSVYDKDGVFMDNLHSEVERIVVTPDKIPQHLKDAYTSIEDQRFYSHKGVDPIRIAGSIVTDITKIFKRQSGMHGGSTLTQQLLKNTILSNEDSAVVRKIKEISLALSLEKKLSKDEIISQYLNTIPLGGTVYGVEAASNLYFAKSVNELSLIECAYISGITQAPTYYSAYNENNKKDPSPYINRTKTVLGKMKELGKINDEEYKQAIADIDAGKLVFKSKKNDYKLQYEWYLNPAISQVKTDLKEKYKYSDAEVEKLLANGGLKITTNMDRGLQDFTQNLLNNYTASNIGLKETYIEGTKTPEFQASATVVDYKKGKVLAMIGGRGEHGAQAGNRAYQYLRPIGSNTKPLTVYGPAINDKTLTAASTIDDTPIENNIGKTLDQGKPYAVRNDDHKFSGNVTLREGLEQSKNVVAVTVENEISLKTGLSYGEKFGLIYNNVSKTTYAALALGQFNGNQDGGNTFINASAFGVFGNEGIYTTPKLYSKVVDARGTTLLDTEENIETKEIFSPQTAYIMYDILKGSRETTGSNALWGKMPVSGKTGTTTDSKDLWFSGLTPYLSGSVWLGYDIPKKLGTGYSNLSAGLWGKIMAKAHEGMKVTDIEEPSGIVKVRVCKDSGKLPTQYCTSDPRGRTYEELFIEGTEPTSYCDAHVAEKINTSNGKLATANTPPWLTSPRVFVKKKYPNPQTADYNFVLPTAYDDTQASVIPVTPPITPTDNNNNDKDKDKDKDNKDNTTTTPTTNPTTTPTTTPTTNPNTKPTTNTTTNTEEPKR